MQSSPNNEDLIAAIRYLDPDPLGRRARLARAAKIVGRMPLWFFALICLIATIAHFCGVK